MGVLRVFLNKERTTKKKKKQKNNREEKKENHSIQNLLRNYDVHLCAKELEKENGLRGCAVSGPDHISLKYLFFVLFLFSLSSFCDHMADLFNIFFIYVVDIVDNYFQGYVLL